MVPELAVLEDLFQRRRAGEKTADLAAEVDLRPDTLRTYWRKHLGKNICQKHRWTPEEAQATYDRYLAGEKTADISEELGITTSALRATWKKYLGVVLGGWKSWTVSEAQTTWDRYLAGEPSQALADELGVSKGSLIAAWDRLLGKRARPRGQNREWSLVVLRRAWARRMNRESAANIATDLGCDANVLRAAWSRHGFKNPPKTALLHEELVAALWERCKAGEKGVDLAVEVGVVPSTLYTAWAKRGWSARKQHDYGTIEALNIWVWRDQGQSWSWICGQYGLTPTPKHKGRLQQRLRRYCDRNKLLMPSQVTSAP